MRLERRDAQPAVVLIDGRVPEQQVRRQGDRRRIASRRSEARRPVGHGAISGGGFHNRDANRDQHCDPHRGLQNDSHRRPTLERDRTLWQASLQQRRHGARERYDEKKSADVSPVYSVGSVWFGRRMQNLAPRQQACFGGFMERVQRDLPDKQRGEHARRLAERRVRQPAADAPPESGDDAGVELAPVVECSVGAKEIGLDPCVLPSGDPESVQPVLRHADRSPPVVEGSARHHLRPEGVRRALLQAARRHAIGIAHVVAIPGVGRRRGDRTGLERLRVDPRRVRVGVHQEDRPVRDDDIEVCSPRTTGRLEYRVGPATSHDPREVGMLACERRDPLEVRVPRRQIIEVDVQEDPAGERRVDVRVLEPGHDAGAADDLVRGADAVAHLILGTDGDDPVTLDRDRPYPPPRRIDRVDVSNEDQVRIIHGRGRYHRS